jgi:hypothetical protein
MCGRVHSDGVGAEDDHVDGQKYARRDRINSDGVGDEDDHVDGWMGGGGHQGQADVTIVVDNMARLDGVDDIRLRLARVVDIMVGLEGVMGIRVRLASGVDMVRLDGVVGITL